jgi:hypothetical protein
MRKQQARQDTKPRKQSAAASTYESIKDVIGGIEDGLPSNLAPRKKRYLKTAGYGRKVNRHAKEACNTKA